MERPASTTVPHCPTVFRGNPAIMGKIAGRQRAGRVWSGLPKQDTVDAHERALRESRRQPEERQAPRRPGAAVRGQRRQPTLDLQLHVRRSPARTCHRQISCHVAGRRTGEAGRTERGKGSGAGSQELFWLARPSRTERSRSARTWPPSSPTCAANGRRRHLKEWQQSMDRIAGPLMDKADGETDAGRRAGRHRAGLGNHQRDRPTCLGPHRADNRARDGGRSRPVQRRQPLRQRPAGPAPRGGGREAWPAMPWRDLPSFFAELRQRAETAARALELLLLTCCPRTSEVMPGDVGRDRLAGDNYDERCTSTRMSG